MYIYKKFGGLAHLARALAWQARGNRFDSGILHKKTVAIDGFFYFSFFKSSATFSNS